MNNLFSGIFNWIKDDWESNPVRCILEIFAWLLSLACSVTLMVMLPGMPEKSLFLILYPMFIIQCMIFGWAAWTRRSLGMLANYILLTTIDSVGLVRMINIL